MGKAKGSVVKLSAAGSGGSEAGKASAGSAQDVTETTDHEIQAGQNPE